jgi:ATP-dependent Clp protease ATP-binding subunit ClpC
MGVVFERFTDRARRVVVLAQDASRQLGHNWIGTEHLLLALLREDEGVAPAALRSLGVSLEAAQAEVERIVPRESKDPKGHIPFTPRSKKVLELSLREALQLGHNYIGTEHILLGLVREGEGVGAQVLEKLGARQVRVRARVLELMEKLPPEPVAEASHPVSEMIIQSVLAENRTLREEVDRLREALRRLEPPTAAAD